MSAEEEDIVMLERDDPHTDLRNKLRIIANLKDEWCGVPMPLEGERLVIESNYPFAGLTDIGQEPEQADPDIHVRNKFWSSRKMSDVVIWENVGKIEWGLHLGVHHLYQDLRTLGCSNAWGIEQERRALQLLGTLIEHHAFKQYLLTGMFLETSEHSHVVYLFRRLKPTVAITTKNETPKILCALCMHPIAYYAESWAGAMCPTDDVIAHLTLMRGDERRFWSRCSQHPAYRAEAGL